MSAYRAKPRLTLKELVPIIEFYHERFPTWTIVRNDTLVREISPVIQGITFERLSGEDYRPIGHIRVLVAPRDHWACELAQHLKHPVNSIRQRDHVGKRDRVVEAIRTEFTPSVEKPLVAEEVLKLYEREANPARSADAYSLAALNAYLGHDDRAKYWCKRFDELVTEGGGEWQDFDYERRAFLDQIEKWLDAGDAKPQLERVLQDERRKWGLA